MIYAIRRIGSRETLVEIDHPEHLPSFVKIPLSAAHHWVISGKEHETGLFVNDDGKVEYAPAEGE